MGDCGGGCGLSDMAGEERRRLEWSLNWDREREREHKEAAREEKEARELAERRRTTPYIPMQIIRESVFQAGPTISNYLCETMWKHFGKTVGTDLQPLSNDGIPYCLCGFHALIHYRAVPVDKDWGRYTICVPDEQLEQASQVLRRRKNLILCEELPKCYRFYAEGRDSWNAPLRFKFQLEPSSAFHLKVTQESIVQLHGLPFPSLEVFVQSLLSLRKGAELERVVDAKGLDTAWGEANLSLAALDKDSQSLWTKVSSFSARNTRTQRRHSSMDVHGPPKIPHGLLDFNIELDLQRQERKRKQWRAEAKERERQRKREEMEREARIRERVRNVTRGNSGNNKNVTRQESTNGNEGLTSKRRSFLGAIIGAISVADKTRQ